MLSWTNTNSSGANVTTALGPTYVTAASTPPNVPSGVYLFCPTAQSLVTAGVTNQVIDDADRTATTCYMKGYSEHIRFQTSSALPWFWRRICFTYKGPLGSQSVAPSNSEVPYIDTSNGMERLWLNLSVNGSSTYINTLFTILFKGAVNQDWTDPVIAPLDTTRISVKYDRTQTIRSTNGVGTIGERKMYHPMNKNLTYDDDESGAASTTKYTSVSSKAGMGDFYVMDLFSPGVGGASGDIIRIDANSTLYWHEK